MDVPLETFIRVMKAGGVSLSHTETPSGIKTTLVRGETVEAQFFSDPIPRRLVVRLAIKFGVPREYFWHEEMIPPPQAVPPSLRPN